MSRSQWGPLGSLQSVPPSLLLTQSAGRTTGGQPRRSQPQAGDLSHFLLLFLACSLWNMLQSFGGWTGTSGHLPLLAPVPPLKCECPVGLPRWESPAKPLFIASHRLGSRRGCLEELQGVRGERKVGTPYSLHVLRGGMSSRHTPRSPLYGPRGSPVSAFCGCLLGRARLTAQQPRVPASL